MNIQKNRSEVNYTHKEMVLRILWAFVYPLFRFSPRPFFGWRVLLLRLFGSEIGREVHIYSTAVITLPWNLKVGDWSSIGEHALIYNLGPVTIGHSVTVSLRAHICAGTHDYTAASMPLLKLPVRLENQAWICADAFVGPGVTVGEGAVVGARGVAVKDVSPWTVVAGNPARELGKRSIEKE